MALRSCCGCISLKVGSLIIGIFSLIGCVCLFIPFFGLPEKLAALDKLEVEKVTKDLIFCLVKGVVALCITYSILITILTVVFIIGVLKARSEFIAPYLWVGFTSSLLIIPLGISIITMASSAPEPWTIYLWVYFCEYLFGSILNVYFLMVVYYHYQEVKQENSHGVIHSRGAA